MTRTAMTLAALLCLPSMASAAAPLPRVGAWAPEEVTSSPPPPQEVPMQRPEAPPPVTSDPPAESAPPPANEVIGPMPPTPEPAPDPGPPDPALFDHPPAEPPADGVPTEPAPVEVAPVDPPASEPEPIEPIEPVDELEPAPHLTPRSPPPLAGAGMRVGGGIIVGSGGLTVLSGIILLGVNAAYVGDPYLSGLGAAVILVGGAQVGGGVALIRPGMRRARALREWEAEHAIDAPNAGYGMIVGGSVLVGAGGLNMITVAVNSGLTGEVPVGNLLLGLGELGAGAALLTIGTKRRKAYGEWEKRHFGTPSLSLLPGGGMSVGLSGRF